MSLCSDVSSFTHNSYEDNLIRKAISSAKKWYATKNPDKLNNAERYFEIAVYHLNAQTSKLCFACGCPSGGTQSEMCLVATHTGVHGGCHGDAEEIFYLLRKLKHLLSYNALNDITCANRELGECIKKLEADYENLTGRIYADDAVLLRRLEEGTSCPDSAE